LKNRDFVIYKSLIERATSAEIRDSQKQKILSNLSKVEKDEFQQKLEECRRKKVEIVTYLDNSYPEILRQIPDYPTVLYCCGNINLLREKHFVAMVGSRRATDYGLLVAKKFSAKIAGAGAVIVSGMALGIDGMCHRGALSVNGKTIAVLGTAIDNLYPKENEALGKKIVESGGCVVSEYPPGYWTNKFNFPMRNRIIAGLSSATVVIEAAENSGALITAGLTLDYNRNLYAVPSDIGKLSGQGTNRLLLQGAICLISPQVIIEDLGLSGAVQNIKLTVQEAKIIEVIRSGCDNFDKITNKLKIKSNELNVLLAGLEIRGLIKKSADKIQTFD